MLYSEIIAVCSQIHTKHINTLCGQNVECRTYRAVNTLRLCYKNQPVNAVQWNNRCLFSDPHKTHKYTLWAERRIVWMLNWWDIQWPLCGTYSDHCAVHIVTTGLWMITHLSQNAKFLKSLFWAISKTSVLKTLQWHSLRHKLFPVKRHNCTLYSDWAEGWTVRGCTSGRAKDFSLQRTKKMSVNFAKC